MRRTAAFALVVLLSTGAQAQAQAVPPPDVATRAPASTPESCDDGIQNGPESDIDCGGDCPPCERKALCVHASDCLSGLCADGTCHERRLLPGEAVPPGYDTELARRDAAASVRLVGEIFVGVGYGSAYVAALSYPGGIGALYVPVLGPWLTLKQAETTGGKALLAANGTVQGVGTILLVGGFAVAGKQLVRKPPPEEARVRFLPAIGKRSWGLSVGGRF